MTTREAKIALLAQKYNLPSFALLDLRLAFTAVKDGVDNDTQSQAKRELKAVKKFMDTAFGCSLTDDEVDILLPW